MVISLPCGGGPECGGEEICWPGIQLKRGRGVCNGRLKTGRQSDKTTLSHAKFAWQSQVPGCVEDCPSSVRVLTYIFRITFFRNMQEKNTNFVNFRSLREQAGMTLSQLSELSGYSIASINGLELNDIGSKRLRDRILSILLQKSEEGDKTEIQHWRDRALAAESKLEQLKSAMQGWLKKI
ncbi:helix-turn-helix transcriptional regulator [uncultured Akkermansia sp.]|uniref:helix-turn-helix domain-containing protein n=2 Tax=uncultured Akkermansia sp. TaxID=512294 RepID=UPI00260F358E|nr:helix-turn-helix transcriptional regulator [uncultured Akkermansia sp.]